MNPVIDALSRSLRDLFHLRVMFVVIWPIVAAAILWMVLGWLFWDTASQWIASGLQAIHIQDWLNEVEPRWIANAVQMLAHMILFVPLVFITALLITALFAMPMLLRIVAERDYPQLQRKDGGSLSGNLLNAVFALAVFIAIWLITLPLWLVGIGVVVPFIAAAYLNQRLFRYDALAEHASRDELATLFSRYQSSWWGLGMITGLLQFVPFLNLLAPVFAGLAFIHFGLARLQELRQG